MATILFVTIDAGGNTPPAIAIAGALAARGHRILFLGHPNQENRITDAGFEFRGFGGMRPWNRTQRSSAARVISDFVFAATSPRLAQDFRDVAAEEHIDFAVVDCMLLSVCRAAATGRIPYVVLFHTFYAYWNGGWARGPVARLAQLRGLNARAIWKTADLELVATDAALDPARSAATARRVWTGTTEHAGVGDHPDGGRARVLVSFSTAWMPGQVDVYRRTIAALASLPAEAIVTTGGRATAEELPSAPNVTVLGFADHDAILPTVDLLITHGGHSTAMKAIANGVPCLVIPMHPLMDQPMVGAAIQDAGLGLRIKKSAPPEAIAKSITTILAEPGYRAAAREAARREVAGDGPAAAADQVEQVLRTAAEHSAAHVQPDDTGR
ncbi:glycosyltransferase [Leifsonia sp. RAF41]|uniref:glycosyltransferase n=1 Tax=Leifsonia sp. RAF41 TaxID=3233056 RepID=UPI003F9D387F